MNDSPHRRPDENGDVWRPPAEGEAASQGAGSQAWHPPTGSGSWGAAPDPSSSGYVGSTYPYYTGGEAAGGTGPAQSGSGFMSRLSGSRRGIAVLAGVALGAGLLGGGVGAAVTYGVTDRSSSFVNASPDPQASQASSAPSGSVQQVANKVLPSVVSIGVSTPRGQGAGSGVILDSNGLILTNNHVVAPAAAGGELSVTFNDGSEAQAKVVGRDPVTDLAVIQAEGVSGVQPATLGGSSALQVGQNVVAIGSPLGLSGTVTTGIISAKHRPVRVGGQAGSDRSTVIDAVQTDAAINPGNSGGPLVNMNGEVVGINTAIASPGGNSGSIGLGFAIPIDQARTIAKQLTENGTAAHARLGVRVTDARSSQQDVEGAGIVQVQPGTAAANSSLKSGDVVVKVGDRPIDSADALIAAVRSRSPGDKVSITYVRDGSEQTTTVRLGSDAPST